MVHCRSNPPITLSMKSYMAAEDSDTGIKIYLREIGQIPLLTPDQEIELAAKIKKGDREARALMIRSNLRLVVKIAHDYANLGLPLLDLISEGNIGLMKAVERFDPAKGGKLSTYAAWWIKQSIKRALANQSKTIRLPVHLVDKISKMRRVSLQMSEELGREPTDDELGEEIGIAAGKVSQLKTVSIRPASLDAPISDDDSTEFGEIVGDEEAMTPFELLRDKNLRNEVGGLLEVLDDRERKIIFSRFGLDGGKPKTLEEVGKKFGVTRERIRQLQNIALSKLHGVHQRIACAQVADNHQIVARRSQSRVAQIFLGYFDGGVRIIRKFYPRRIRPPTKRELASHFLARSEGKNRGVFRTQIRSITSHCAVPGKHDDPRSRERVCQHDRRCDSFLSHIFQHSCFGVTGATAALDA